MMRRLNDWLRAREPKREYEWPDCDPDDGCLAFGCNGVSYKKEETSPGRWQWVVDRELMNLAAAREARKSELFWALRTRVLTDAEMAEALSHGESLNVRSMEPYYAADKYRELNEAYYQQARLRSLAAQPAERTAAEMRREIEG